MCVLRLTVLDEKLRFDHTELSTDASFKKVTFQWHLFTFYRAVVVGLVQSEHMSQNQECSTGMTNESALCRQWIPWVGNRNSCTLHIVITASGYSSGTRLLYHAQTVHHYFDDQMVLRCLMSISGDPWYLRYLESENKLQFSLRRPQIRLPSILLEKMLISYWDHLSTCLDKSIMVIQIPDSVEGVWSEFYNCPRILESCAWFQTKI